MSGILLKVNTGVALPQGLVDKIFDTKPNVFSYATVNPVENAEKTALEFEQILEWLDDDKPLPTRENFQEFLDGFETDVVCWFHTIDLDKFQEDDLQPYILGVDSDDKPYLLAFLSGDYSNHAVGDSPRADAYHALQGVLEPRAEQIHELAAGTGGSMEHFTKAFDAPVIKKEFASIAKKDGVIALIFDDPSSEHAIKFYASPDGSIGSYEWGLVNNSLGYKDGEAPATASVAEPSMAETMREGRLQKLARLKREAIAKATGQPVATAVGPQPENKVVETSSEGKQKLTAIVPTGYNKWDNAQKKAWMNKTFGTLLTGWKKYRPGVTVTYTPIADVTPVVEAKKEVLKDLRDLGKVAEKELISAPEKDTTTHNIPHKAVDQVHNAPLTKDDKPSTFGVVPVSSRKAYKDVFLESVSVKELLKDFQDGQIMDLENLKKLTDKRESFYDASGGCTYDMVMAFAPAIPKMVSDHPSMTSSLIMSLLADYFKVKVQLEAKEAKAAGTPVETPPVKEKMTLREKAQAAAAKRVAA